MKFLQLTNRKLAQPVALSAALVMAASCGAPDSGPPPSPAPQVSEIPTYSWPDETWHVSTLEAEGFDPLPIDAFVEELLSGDFRLVDHFLLIRHGRIVVDERFNHNYDIVFASVPEDQRSNDAPYEQYEYENSDWHPYYRDTRLHSLQSVTKSITSAALGAAIDQGRINGVDIPVMPFFADYEFDRTDPRKADITLEDLLTMRSGIDWETDGGYDASTHSTVLLENSDAWIDFILDRPMDADPGTVFEYNDGVSVLLGKILRVATGQRIDDWAEEHLFKPIGIDEFYWKITPDGEADTEGGLYLTAYDLARIGYLFLRNGQWKDDQILSKEWVEKSTALQVPNARRTGLGYGYQWWVPHNENGEAKTFDANGYGGQRLIIVPEHDIVAVFTGWNIRGNQTIAANTFRDEVLPEALLSCD
ncbi:MAG: serine hydrolase [Pseudomonadota bacterium]